MSGAPLYALTAGYEQLLDAAQGAGDDELEAAIAALDEQVQAKCSGIVRVLAQLEADAATAAEESKRLAGRAKTYETRIEQLRVYVKACMTQAGIKRVSSPQFAITVCDGQPKVLITDASKVPPELMRQPKVPAPEPDKVAILKMHIATGVIPPGCDIVATTKLMVR